MTPKLTAGRRLRADLDAMLARARHELGEPDLTWDERELDALLARIADLVPLDLVRPAADGGEVGVEGQEVGVGRAARGIPAARPWFRNRHEALRHLRPLRVLHGQGGACPGDG